MKLAFEIPPLRTLNWRRGIARSFVLAWALLAWGSACELFAPRLEAVRVSSAHSRLEELERARIRRDLERTAKEQQREAAGLPPLPVSLAEIRTELNGVVSMLRRERASENRKIGEWLARPVALPGLLLLGFWTVRGFRRDEPLTPAPPKED